METIRNYLESMFTALPNTDQVHRAKDELCGMMEDKFQALIDEGVSEDEAIAKVIAEFGSLDEIAEELGIGEAVVVAKENVRRLVSQPEAEEFLKDSRKVARRRAFGVALVVASGACISIAEVVARYLYGRGNYPTSVVEGVGALAMFLLVALGVGTIIMSTSRQQKWAFLHHEACQLDYPALAFVDEQYQAAQEKLSLRLAVGVGCFILAIFPPLLFSDFSWGYLFGRLSMGAFLLVGAVGVYLILSTQWRRWSFEQLLTLNGKDTVGGNQFLSQKQLHFDEPMIEEVMGVYWQTVLCLYLCWSFLTFSWARTWIIWPVAALVHWLIRRLFGKESV